MVFSTKNARNAIIRLPLNRPCVHSRTLKLYLSLSSIIPYYCLVISYIIYYLAWYLQLCPPPRMLPPFPLQLRLLKQPGYLPLLTHLLLASASNYLIYSLLLVVQIPTSSWWTCSRTLLATPECHYISN